MHWSSDPTARGVRVRCGFTMLELLVVVAIIAILASFVAPSVFQNVGDAKQASARTQIEAFVLALNAYRLDTDQYPSTEMGLEALRSPNAANAVSTRWRGPYVSKNIGVDPWGNPYQYAAPGEHNPDSFDLVSFGRDGAPGGEGEDADISSWDAPGKR